MRVVESFCPSSSIYFSYKRTTSERCEKKCIGPRPAQNPGSSGERASHFTYHQCLHFFTTSNSLSKACCSLSFTLWATRDSAKVLTRLWVQVTVSCFHSKLLISQVTIFPQSEAPYSSALESLVREGFNRKYDMGLFCSFIKDKNAVLLILHSGSFL